MSSTQLIDTATLIGMSKNSHENPIRLVGYDLKNIDWCHPGLSTTETPECNNTSARGQNKDLPGFYIEDSDLSGCRFNNSNINYISFINCIMKEAEFLNSVLHSCRFDGSDMSGSSIENCAFAESSLRGLNLTRSNLLKVHFAECNMRGADLRSCSKSRITFDKMKMKLLKADFPVMEFQGLPWQRFKVVLFGDNLQIGYTAFSLQDWLEMSEDEVNDIEPLAIPFLNNNADYLKALASTSLES